MRSSRLGLRKELLTDLSTDELRGLAGGNTPLPPTITCDQSCISQCPTCHTCGQPCWEVSAGSCLCGTSE